MAQIVALESSDIRFPTSVSLAGSDAMNADPDYSAGYLVLRSDAADGLSGHGFVFTIGRGTEIAVAAIDALAAGLVGRELEPLLADLGETSRRLLHDSQLRWLGPEKGVMHMAIGAVVNALWDLRAKRAGLPLWRLLAELSPDELVDLVDWRYLSDRLSPAGARELLEAARPGRAERTELLLAEGYPAYTTGPGWIGYDDATLERLCRQAVADGFDQVKLKVGRSIEEDRRRLRIARAAVGPNVAIAIDANQRWDVAEAIDWVQALAEFDLRWVEEPTSPDDILGHAAIARAIAPIPVATGEHAANRVVFKQLLQAEAIGVMQIDAVRVAGVNENIANLLLAADAGVPVCPHAGGVGLCESVQHLSMFDFVAVSGSWEGRRLEYMDSLHEHFVHPVRLARGRYLAPEAPGAGTELRAESIAAFRFDPQKGSA